MTPDAIKDRIVRTLRLTNHPLTPDEISYQCLPRNVPDAARDAALAALASEGKVGLDGGVVVLKSRKGVPV